MLDLVYCYKNHQSVIIYRGPCKSNCASLTIRTPGNTGYSGDLNPNNQPKL